MQAIERAQPVACQPQHAQLIELHNQKGNQWKVIASLMRGRTDAAVKSRFESNRDAWAAAGRIAVVQPSVSSVSQTWTAEVGAISENEERARRDFEKAHGDRMRAELVEGPEDPEASIEFPPMQKVWRNILHELAGELHLHAESVELEDPTAGGDKFVVVYRKPPVVELTEAEEARRAAAAQRARAGAGVKRGEALTDQAPRFAEGDPGPELTVVGTVKRDLRGVAQTIGDMRKRKRDDAGPGGSADSL